MNPYEYLKLFSKSDGVKTFRQRDYFLWGFGVSALFFWLFSLKYINVRDMNDLGLISVFPLAIVIAYSLLILGFACSLTRERINEALLIFYVLLLIWMIHGTPQILYNTLRYSWAWKHVGIVDYIIRHGAVDPKIATLDVYHNWPGFFAISALFTQLAGVSGAQTYAGWGPVFFEMLFAIGLLSLFRLLTVSLRMRYLGVWIFILANWIGQDYFSPQAITYFMFIGILVLTFLGFSSSGPTALFAWQDRLSAGRHIDKYFLLPAKWIASIKIVGVQQNEIKLGNLHRFVLGTIILLCFIMIASSHQLTPTMCLEFILVLVLLGYIKWRALPFWMMAIISLWFLGPARSYNDEIIKSIFSAYGQMVSNIDSGFIDVAKVSSGQALVSWMGRGLTIIVAILATIGVFRRILHRYLDLVIIMFAGIPILMFLLNSYGGELIFRVYFFSLPALSLLAASAFFPDDKPAPNWMHVISISGVSLLLFVGFLFGYYGKDRQYYFTQGEVDAAEYVYSHAAPNSMLIEGSRNYPSQFLNYEYFTYIPLDREPVDSRSDFLNNPASVFFRWMSNPDYSSSYLIITRSQKNATNALGTLPPGALENIETELTNSDLFQIVYSNQDAVVFMLRSAE